MFQERVVFDNTQPHPPNLMDGSTRARETKRKKSSLPPWLSAIWLRTLGQRSDEVSLETRKSRETSTKDEGLGEIVDFLIREVLPLPEPEKTSLLEHYLGSIAREAHQVSSHLAYAIDFTESGEIKLIDPFYQKSQEVIKVCRDSVEKASSSLARSRYLLELKQAETLIAALGQMAPFNTGAPQVLKEVEKLSEKVLSKTFEAIGWKETNKLIMPELASQLDLSSPLTKCWVGKKSLYVMPESEVHPGGFSVVVLVQPAFLPEKNRWVLLQSQYMIQLSQTNLIRLLQKLGQDILSEQRLNFAEIEQKAMSLLIDLGNETQLLSAEEVFSDLLIEFETRNQAQRLEKATRVNQLNLESYALYLVEIFQLENYKQGLNREQKERLVLAVKRVVLAGIFDLNSVGSAEVDKLIKHYQQFASGQQQTKSVWRQASRSLETIFATSLTETVGFASATKAFDTSLIECLTMSPFSAITSQRGGLTTSNLIKPNGSWGFAEGRGCMTCPACGHKSITPYVCSHCGYVRGAPLPKPLDQTISHHQNHTPNIPTPNTSQHTNLESRSVGLGAFVAGLDQMETMSLN